MIIPGIMEHIERAVCIVVTQLQYIHQVTIVRNRRLSIKLLGLFMVNQHIERAGVHSGDSIAVYPQKR